MVKKNPAEAGFCFRLHLTLCTDLTPRLASEWAFARPRPSCWAWPGLLSGLVACRERPCGLRAQRRLGWRRSSGLRCRWCRSNRGRATFLRCRLLRSLLGGRLCSRLGGGAGLLGSDLLLRRSRLLYHRLLRRCCLLLRRRGLLGCGLLCRCSLLRRCSLLLCRRSLLLCRCSLLLRRSGLLDCRLLRRCSLLRRSRLLLGGRGLLDCRLLRRCSLLRYGLLSGSGLLGRCFLCSCHHNSP